MYNLGVDIGGMSIKCGIVAEDGTIFGEKKTIVTKKDPIECADSIAQLCLDTCKTNNIDFALIDGIGIGVPGTIHQGVASFVSNLGWYNFPICDILSKKLGKKVVGGNDANCATLAEWKYGSAKGYDNMALVTLGTGVGTGFVIDNRLLLGNRSSGTEGGHIIIKVGGKKCNCGLAGCWEKYAATTALLEEVKKEVKKTPTGIMAKIAQSKDGVDGFTVFEAIDQGDEKAQKILDQYVKYISIGLINISNIFRPEIIVIGGGISRQTRVVAPLEDIVNDVAYGGGTNPIVKVCPAVFGNDAGIIGAAILPTL